MLSVLVESILTSEGNAHFVHILALPRRGILCRVILLLDADWSRINYELTIYSLVAGCV